jgi:hypothetical protein
LCLVRIPSLLPRVVIFGVLTCVVDPDNYWIEVVQNEALKSRASW